MRLRPFIGWAIFFFLVAIIVQVVPSVTGSYYFLKGKHSFARGNYEAAAAAYERLVSSDPKFARGYIELGLAYYELEKYPQAEDAFRKAVNIHDDSCAECGLGMALHAQDRNEEAEKVLKKAVELNPRDTCALNQMGRMYYKLEQYPEAIEAFGNEIKLRPSAIAYHFLGNSHLFSNQYEKALTAYREALRINPNYYSHYVSMGHAAQHLGYLDQAIDAYHKAIRADADDAEARVGLISTELKRGNSQAASEHYQVLRRLDPEWADKVFRDIEKRAAKTSSRR